MVYKKLTVILISNARQRSALNEENVIKKRD